MTNELIPFNFEGNNIRVIQDERGDPLFAAADVCKVLGLSDTNRAVRGLDDDEKGTTEISTPGGTQKMIVVNESGLYTLIIRSNKSEAKPFRKWITAEVLPTLRKTGGYTTRPMSPAETALMHAQILVDQERRLAIVEREQTAQQDRLALVEAEQATTKGGLQMMTVAGYAKWKGLSLSDGELSSAGRKCTAYSNANGYPIGKTPHTRLGAINTYHVKVLALYFSQRNLFEGGAQ